MKGNFDAAMAFTLSEEGGYSNNPRDPGGRTNKGITQRTLDLFNTRRKHDVEDVRNLNADDVRDIYSGYWREVSGDTLPTGVDIVMFDIAFMSGSGTAERFYRHGANTIDTLNADHLAFLQSLKTFGTFGNGWTKRVARREAAAQKLAAQPVAPVPTPATSTPQSGVSTSTSAPYAPDKRAFSLSQAVRDATAALENAIGMFHATPLPPAASDTSEGEDTSQKPKDQTMSITLPGSGILGTLSAIFNLATSAAPLVPKVVSDVETFVADVNKVAADIKSGNASTTLADIEQMFSDVATDWSDITNVLNASAGKVVKL